MSQVTDTHRRAELRGREAVAMARIKSGVWAARIFAVMIGVSTIAPLLRRGGPDWITASIIVMLAAALVYAAQRMSGGSQVASRLLLVLFVLIKISDWMLTDQPIYAGLLWNVIVFCALCNGVWGTYNLASVRRDALTVPPAPPRASDKPLV